MKWAGSWVISGSECLFPSCSAANFANLGCVKSLCVGQEQLLETHVEQRMPVNDIELFPILNCEEGRAILGIGNGRVH